MTATTESTALPAVPVFREVRRHVPLVGTQVAAGVGNLAFAVCAARLLGAGEYADIATFLALYLVLHLPAAALSAAGCVGPGQTPRRQGEGRIRRRSLSVCCSARTRWLSATTWG